MTRDDVLKEFYQPYDVEIVPGLRRGGMQLDTEAMADEIVRLRAILANLRNPSMAVMAGAFSAGAIWDVVTHTRKTIQLAVAAAEREVANEVR